MKIAHVCPFYTPAIGGVKQVVEELAERQVKEGHEVHIYTSDWDKTKRIKIKNEKINNVHVHRCTHILRVANFVTIWPSVLQKLIKGKFDIIHSHLFGHPHFIFSTIASKISKARHIHTTHCPWSDAHRSIPGRIGLFFSYNFFSRFSLRSVDKIIAITPWEISFIKKYGGREEQIEVIPNGVSNVFFEKIKINDFKKKNKINGKIVLFFGRLNKTKGPEKFVEIAKSILKKRNDITFVIVGPDEGMRDKIKEMIKNHKKIILLPEVRDRKEVVKIYQSAEVYVMPSYREGLPLTLFEAMARGLPIVASPVNGIPYEMKEPQNGFLVKYGENKTFEKRILELIDNNQLRKKISIENIKTSKNYRWDSISKKTIDLYKKVLSR